MNKDKSLKIKTGILMILMLVTFTAITYGAFLAIERQTTENVLSADCFRTTFTNNSSSINLTGMDTIPLSDAAGLNTTPYTFTVTNTCNLDSYYYVILSTKGTINNSDIKVSLNNSTPTLLNSEDINNLFPASGYDNSYIIGTGTLANGESFNGSLKIWLDESMEYNSTTTTWEGELKVVSEVKEFRDSGQSQS